MKIVLCRPSVNGLHFNFQSEKNLFNKSLSNILKKSVVILYNHKARQFLDSFGKEIDIVSVGGGIGGDKGEGSGDGG